MNHPTFRDARIEDVPAILALSDAGAPPGQERRADPESYRDPRYAGAFAAVEADPAHRLIVAESGGEVVGTLQISIVPGLPNFGLSRGFAGERPHPCGPARQGPWQSHDAFCDRALP